MSFIFGIFVGFLLGILLMCLLTMSYKSNNEDMNNI